MSPVVKIWPLLGVVMAFMGPAATAAVAQAPFERASFLNQCSTGSIKTCASFQTETYRYQSATGWRTQIYIRVRNLYSILSDGRTGGSTLNRLGVLLPKDMLDERFENALNTAQNRGGTSRVFTEEGATQSGSPADFWSMGRSSLNSLGRIEFGAATQNPVGGINDCIGPAAQQRASGKNKTPTYYRTCVNTAPAGWTTFAFTTASEVDPSKMQMAWGVVAVRDPLTGNQDLGSYQGETCLNCVPTEVVPEPISMVLLGSGLAGLGGMNFLRRLRERAGGVPGQDGPDGPEALA